MTTYYVDKAGGADGNTGLTGHPWKTLSKAAGAMADGDTVLITPGTYYEAITISKENTTWQVNGAGSVTLDGGYSYATAATASGGDELKEPKNVAGSLLKDRNAAMIRITGSGTTIDGGSDYGFIIRNSGGRFLGISPANDNAPMLADITVKHLHGDCAYYMACSIKKCDNVLIEDCAFTKHTLINFGPEREKHGRRFTPTSCPILDSTNITYRRVYVAYGAGEGIDAGSGSNGVVFENCECHNMGHTHYYINGSRNSVIRGCIAWSDPRIGNKEVSIYATGEKLVSSGITLGDETLKSLVHGNSSRNPKVYGNLIVGCQDGIVIRGNSNNYTATLTDLYVGYNTVVGYRPPGTASESGSRNLINISTPLEGPHGGIIENNVLLYMDGQVPAGSGSFASGGNNNVTWRNNIWYKQPPTTMRGSGEIYSSQLLSDQQYILPRTYYNHRSTELTEIISLRDDLSWAELRPSSPAVGHATTGGVAGFTPPAGVTTDLLGNARDSDPDCGAIEFDGTPVDPADTLTASFTQSATTGTVPLTVNFVDTSVSSGTKDQWSWNFGDDTTSAVQNPSHAYNTAGTYTPILTVRDDNGLQKTKSGQPITVTAQGDPDPGDPDGTATVKAAVTRAALNTSTGEQVVSVDLGGLVPSLVLALTSRATVVGTPAADAMICIGAWSPVRQKAHVIFSEDGQATTNPKSFVDDSIAVWLNENGVVGNARVASVAADTVTLDVTDDFPVGGLCTVVAFAGGQFSGAVDHLLQGSNGSSTKATGGDMMLLFSAWVDDTVADGAQMSLGGATAEAQGHSAFREYGNQSASNINSTSGADSIAHFFDGTSRVYVVSSHVGNGTLAVSGGSIGGYATAVSLTVDGGFKYGQFTAPNSTGNVSYDLGFEPEFALLWGSLNPGVGGVANNNVNNNGLWVAVLGPDGDTYFSGISITDDADTSETQSNAEDSIKVYSGDGTVRLAGDITADADGFDIDWTVARGVTVNYLAFEGGGVEPNLPVAAFTAYPRQVDEGGTVAFQNNTNANGATVTGYAWDFGDGGESTEASPTHTYDEADDYTVTLSVRSVDNDNVVLTKTRYITVVYVPQTVEMIGPYDAMIITHQTRNRRHTDLSDPDRFCYYELEVDFDGDESDIDPVADGREVRVGKLWRYVISNEDGSFTLKAKDSAGNLYTGPTYEAD